MNETVRESILRSISQLQQNQERSDNLAATHQPEEPNTAAPALDFARNFSGGGLQRALDLPNNFIGKSLQNADNQAALPGMGMAASWAPRAKALFDAGHSYAEIAQKLGTSRNAVAGTLRDLRGAGQLGPAKEAPIGFSNPELWNTAKELRSQGLSRAGISRELGVSPSAVGKAFKRGSGPDNIPGMPELKFMNRLTEEIDPEELKRFLNIFKPK